MWIWLCNVTLETWNCLGIIKLESDIEKYNMDFGYKMWNWKNEIWSWKLILKHEMWNVEHGIKCGAKMCGWIWILKHEM